ncbi:MAG: hypothetical protein ABR501_05695, partial [Pyrinomonadaceae bacterium]
LKRVGEFAVPLRLHREVTIDLQVKIVPEGEVIIGHLSPEQEAELAKQPGNASEEQQVATSE